jgi:branched-subunit amino acid aminotransferase/4-amino-4-deoxychorismate lyase
LEPQYINLNGEMVDASVPVLFADNRGVRYGDAIFESMRFSHNEILFYEDHFDRLKRAMNVIGIRSNENFSPNNLRFHIHALVQANRITGSAKIRLTIFRNGAGTYVPQTGESSFIIHSEPLPENFLLNMEGLRIDIFREMKKQVNILSPFKSANSMLYVLAGLFKTKNNLDDCIILNDKDNICEAITSNIFIRKNNQTITPPLSDGCIDGVMRKNIIRLMEQEGMPCIEKSLSVSDLQTADEVFLTNVSMGIRWVGALNQKRFYNKFSSSVFPLLLGLAEIKKV